MNKKTFLIPLVLFVFLFFLWGFAHSILDVLNKHFQDVLVISKSRSALVQVAVYLAYFLMAIPAGIFIRKFKYKKSVIFGLFLFAIGCFLFIPADHIGSFPFFIFSLFVIGSGLTFLETASNPYIVALGSPENGAVRLNFAQSFNGLGWIVGPLVGGLLIFNEDGTQGGVSLPYMILGSFVLLIGFLFLCIKLPKIPIEYEKMMIVEENESLFKNRLFLFGVFAQFLYVGAQTGINSFFINYVIEINTNLTPRDASVILSLAGMSLFLAGRLLGSLILLKMKAESLLKWVSFGAIICMILVVFSFEHVSFYALIVTYLFMSVMFPTIFAISIKNAGKQTSKGSSLLIMSIVGGAIVPPLMGWIGDSKMALGFVVPLVCFSIIFIFSLFVRKKGLQS